MKLRVKKPTFMNFPFTEENNVEIGDVVFISSYSTQSDKNPFVEIVRIVGTVIQVNKGVMDNNIYILMYSRGKIRVASPAYRLDHIVRYRSPDEF